MDIYTILTIVIGLLAMVASFVRRCGGLDWEK